MGALWRAFAEGRAGLKMKENMKIASVRTIAVMGLGTMGHGIAQAFAAAGYSVRCWDQQATLARSLHARVRKNLSEFVDAGLERPRNVERILSRISLGASEEEAIGPSQMVFEAVREDLSLKQALLARWESMASASTIFASNSSSFPISRSAATMKRPERAIVAHWFNPPHIVPTVEIVPGRRTSRRTTALMLALLRRIGKEAVLLRKEIPGFLVNRLQMALYRELWALWSAGVADPAEIDRAVRGSVGFRLAAMGPLEVCDFGGLDVQMTVYRSLVPHLRSGLEVPPRLRALVRSGGYGVKSGKGFYSYTSASAERRRSRRDRRFLALFKMLYRGAGPSGGD